MLFSRALLFLFHNGNGRYGAVHGAPARHSVPRFLSRGVLPDVRGGAFASRDVRGLSTRTLGLSLSPGGALNNKTQAAVTSSKITKGGESGLGLSLPVA